MLLHLTHADQYGHKQHFLTMSISPLDPLNPKHLGSSVGRAHADQKTVGLAFTKEGHGIISKMMKQAMEQLKTTVMISEEEEED